MSSLRVTGAGAAPLKRSGTAPQKAIGGGGAAPGTGSKKTGDDKEKFLKAFAKAAADVAVNKKPQPKGKADPAKKAKHQQYRNLLNPGVKEAKKQQAIEAFEKLKAMSVEDMQVSATSVPSGSAVRGRLPMPAPS